MQEIIDASTVKYIDEDAPGDSFYLLDADKKPLARFERVEIVDDRGWYTRWKVQYVLDKPGESV